MTQPFVPIGTRARWRIIYDLLREIPVDGILTYETMGEALELDPVDDRHTMQVAMRRAAQELEIQDGHAVTAEVGVGYRIVQVSEHLTLARSQQRRSNRALARGHSKVTNVDLTGVEPEVQKAFHVVASAFAMQMDFNRRLDVRQRNLEESLQTMSTKTERTAEELAEVQARLDRLDRLRASEGLPTTKDPDQGEASEQRQIGG